MEDDLSGKMVNFASRLVSWPQDDWIIISNNAKEHIEDELGSASEGFSFLPYIVNDLKGFLGEHTIWRAEYLETFSSREINTESLATYLRHKFPDRVHAVPQSVSQLADQLKARGHMTLGDIEQAIRKGWNALLTYEPRRYIGNDLICRPSNKDLRLSDVAAIRSLFYIVDENFRVMSGDHFFGLTNGKTKRGASTLKEIVEETPSCPRPVNSIVRPLSRNCAFEFETTKM